MARPRTGSAFMRKGKVYVQVTLRAEVQSEKGKRFWTGECPPRKDKVPVDLVHAKAVARDLQRLHDAGKWDPFAVPEEEASPSGTSTQTLAAFARAWIKTQHYESATKDARSLENYLARAPLGGMAVGEVRPKNIVAFLDWLRKQSSPRGGTLATRTIRNVYDVTRRALDAAVVQELLPANPCAPVHGKLPAVEDKDPNARDRWFFTRTEVWQLLNDARLLEDRRVMYAVEFLTGCRPGELAVLRWRDWDRSQRPLTRLTITRAVKSVTRKEGRTKTGARKMVPVHPHLEKVLTEWFTSGWQRFMGKAPESDDLLVPNKDGNPRNTNRANRDFKRDLKRLKLPERHHYCTRHTFISQAQDDGADGAVLQWATHAPPKTAFNGYTRAQWSRLCAEVEKLKVGPEGSS